ncbi:hypothetical protein SEPCBS119000_000602 [Sporothrix epigloea]|uniref:Xylanolytic transcriptional activator regulatory domain-containing protein n=1 Tax=Sporothrix epigloea TaxID=1892477 RepID=A0ABP0D632_9PEZI
MEHTDYYHGYAGPDSLDNPIRNSNFNAGSPAGYSSGYKIEQQHQKTPPRYGSDVGSPTEQKILHPPSPKQGLRYDAPDVDSHYGYGIDATGESQHKGILKAGEAEPTGINTILYQNRSDQTRNDQNIQLVVSNRSNINILLDQDAGSSISSSNENVPSTISGHTGGGERTATESQECDSPPDGRKPASVVSNPGSNSPSSPTESLRKKQKRNKPTLSETSRSAVAAGGRRVTRPPLSKKASGASTSPSVTNLADLGSPNAPIESLGSVALSTGLLSNFPYSMPSGSNVFGIGSAHPFANYWTCEGGLPEVISVLPDKIQCDILLVRYFECFDPVYPMLNQQSFNTEFEAFSALTSTEKNTADPAFIALLFAMLALGTQFVSSTNPKERKQTAEFYASASNQALRLSSYLSSASVRSIQSMVLITYFLINDNHASDGWAFAGILMRQAYAMGLHRDPNVVTPNASAYEKQQRRKVWQAVLLQDTFLTVLLSLPPTATHTDVKVEDLAEEELFVPDNKNSVTDTAYVRGSWMLANLVQEVISSPRSLDAPLCTTPRQKLKMVSDFRAVYRSFPDIFRSWDAESMTQLFETNKRVVRQTLFLSSNYYHNLMLVHASETPDVPVNVRGTLEAAHDAITSFFVLFKLFESEAGVWWVFNHRAFLEALCIGGILKEVMLKSGANAEATAKETLYARARADIKKMVDVMRIMGEGEHGSAVAQTRIKVLSEFL